MLLNYDELFKPYTKDGHTLENTLKYFQKVASQQDINPNIMELAINEVFSEIANGRVFNKEKCSCGCGIDKAATDLIHTIRDRMLLLEHKKTVLFKELLQQRYNIAIKLVEKDLSKNLSFKNQLCNYLVNLLVDKIKRVNDYEDQVKKLTAIIDYKKPSLLRRLFDQEDNKWP